MDADQQDAMDIEVIDLNDASTLPWVEKYRPKDLSELIAHEDIINVLHKLIDSNKLPHLLFHGPPGKNNTYTIISILCNIYCINYINIINTTLSLYI